jgi:hypothetical protein
MVYGENPFASVLEAETCHLIFPSMLHVSQVHILTWSSFHAARVPGTHSHVIFLPRCKCLRYTFSRDLPSTLHACPRYTFSRDLPSTLQVSQVQILTWSSFHGASVPGTHSHVIFLPRCKCPRYTFSRDLPSTLQVSQVHSSSIQDACDPCKHLSSLVIFQPWCTCPRYTSVHATLVLVQNLSHCLSNMPHVFKIHNP